MQIYLVYEKRDFKPSSPVFISLSEESKDEFLDFYSTFGKEFEVEVHELRSMEYPSLVYAIVNTRTHGVELSLEKPFGYSSIFEIIAVPFDRDIESMKKFALDLVSSKEKFNLEGDL